MSQLAGHIFILVGLIAFLAALLSVLWKGGISKMLCLRQIRLEKGFSVPDLSKAASVPIRTIEDLERRGDGRISTLWKLAEALGISLNEIYTGPTAPSEE